jgi:hypothetical protein
MHEDPYESEAQFLAELADFRAMESIAALFEAEAES